MPAENAVCILTDRPAGSGWAWPRQAASSRAKSGARAETDGAELTGAGTGKTGRPEQSWDGSKKDDVSRAGTG